MEMSMNITRDDRSGGYVLICAVRHSLDRLASDASMVINEIRSMLRDCPDYALWYINRDIIRWLSGRSGVALPCEKQWAEFLDDIKLELSKREEERWNEGLVR